jgi:hypothetical protein
MLAFMPVPAGEHEAESIPAISNSVASWVFISGSFRWSLFRDRDEAASDPTA